MILSADDMQIELIHDGKVWEIATDSDWSIGTHAHDVYEMHIVERGCGVNRLERDEFELGPGTLYMAPPGERHMQRSDPRDPMKLRFFYFKLSIHGSAVILPRIHTVLPDAGRELAELAQLLRADSASGRFLGRLKLIEFIWRLVEPQLSKSAGSSPHFPHKSLERPIAYIRERIADNPAVDDIAAACHLSSRHLSRMFLQHAGISIHKYVQRERLSRVCGLLRDTDMAMQEIADAMGFSSRSYFDCWFRSCSQLTPSAYRAHHRRDGGS